MKVKTKACNYRKKHKFWAYKSEDLWRLSWT